MNYQKLYIGIDVGSISMNLVAVNEDGDNLYEDYRRLGGDPIQAVQNGLSDLHRHFAGEEIIAGVGVTGSGREITGGVVGADVVKNEISAHAEAAIHLHPEARTIFEIGGQDSKMTVIRNRVVEDFAMNLVCAAGTGSFLDSQAKRLDISIEELSARAAESKNSVTIAGRCTVFAETDMIHKQQSGQNQRDILMGLCRAMARNFLSNVCTGKEIQPPIILQGGVSANLGIRRAFEEILECQLIIPRHNLVMGACGAALIARRQRLAETNGESRYKGRELCSRPIETRGFECSQCPNHCEIIEIIDSRKVVGRSGGRCQKWHT